MTRSTLHSALVLAVVAACACVVSMVGLLRPEPVPRRVTPVGLAPVAAPLRLEPPAPSAAAVLAEWDAARAAAWARGSPGELAELYVPGSAAGRRDRSMLRAWAARGLVVEGMTTQLFAVEELARSAQQWALRVTDRLTGAVAVGPGTRRPLPADGASTRTVELRLLDGRWRVASVRTADGGGGALGSP